MQYTNYEQAAEGLGAKGILVETKGSNDGDDTALRDAFQRARKLARDGSPVVVNCFIGHSSFREGSIAV